MSTELWLAVLGVLMAVLGYLLSRKDSQQEAQIRDLWTKHDEDAKRLQDLELDIAKRHYVKDELDAKFDRLEGAIRAMSENLGARFDKLSDALLIQRGK